MTDFKLTITSLGDGYEYHVSFSLNGKVYNGQGTGQFIYGCFDQAMAYVERTEAEDD